MFIKAVFRLGDSQSLSNVFLSPLFPYLYFLMKTYMSPCQNYVNLASSLHINIPAATTLSTIAVPKFVLFFFKEIDITDFKLFSITNFLHRVLKEGRQRWKLSAFFIMEKQNCFLFVWCTCAQVKGVGSAHPITTASPIHPPPPLSPFHPSHLCQSWIIAKPPLIGQLY